MGVLPGIGIFGTDPVVRILVPYLQTKGFRVEALWGLTLQDAQSTAKDLAIPFYTNKVDDVLLRKDVELVFVMCPPNLHSQIAVKALGIGKHVLCDRPAGLSQCEALKMVLAAQYYPSLICVLTHGLRFHSAFIQMKKHVERIGTLQLCQCRIEMGSILGKTFNWLCDDVMGGGNVTLFGSHLIDLISYLTGMRATRVHGLMKTFNVSTAQINGTRRITSPDFAVIEMEMDSGMLVTITLLNHAETTDFSQEILIVGKAGYLRAMNSTIRGKFYTLTKPTEILAPEAHMEKTENILDEIIIFEDDEDDMNSNAATELTPLLPNLYLSGLLKLVSAMREVFSENASNHIDWKREAKIGKLGAGFEEGLYVQAVIEAIKNSAKEKCWVKVNIITEEPDPNPVLTAAVRTSAISL